MKFNKGLIVFLLMVFAFALLAGCASEEQPAVDDGSDEVVDSGEVIAIRWGHFAPPEQPLEVALKLMAERIYDRTDGRVVISTYPASQLGSIADQLEQLIGGGLQMMYSNPSYLTALQSEWSVFDAPFVFDDIDHAREFAFSDLSQALAIELLETRGARILNPSAIFGPRHLSTANTPVRTPADLSGLKIRVHEAETRVDMITSWGASPVVTPTAEMYLSMQTGLADGQESPLSWQSDNKYWEVQKYVMLTGHFIQNEMILINEDFYQSLPDDIREILLEEVDLLADEVTAMYIQRNEEARGIMESEGMVFIDDIDLDAFRAATQSMWEKWEANWGEGNHQRVIERNYVSLSSEEWRNF